MPRYKCIAGPDGSKHVPFTAEEELARDREEAEELAKQLATQYAKDRSKDYGSWESQLDQMWHDIDDGHMSGKDGAWYQFIKAIKDKFPKLGL